MSQRYEAQKIKVVEDLNQFLTYLRFLLECEKAGEKEVENPEKEDFAIFIATDRFFMVMSRKT